MTDETMGAPATGVPTGDGLTDAEKLTALQAYMKALKPIEEQLRAAVTADMEARSVERVGAFLPTGEKLGTVGYRQGNKTARVINPSAALAWCQKEYPEAIVQAVSPAFLKKLTDHAAAVGEVGEPGVDPDTGRVLDFIEVQRGAPGVTVTPTKDGVARMTQLATGFAGMLEAPAGPKPKHSPAFDVDPLPGGGLAPLQPGWPTHVRTARDPWDEEPDPWDEEPGAPRRNSYGAGPGEGR